MEKNIPLLSYFVDVFPTKNDDTNVYVLNTMLNLRPHHESIGLKKVQASSNSITGCVCLRFLELLLEGYLSQFYKFVSCY